MVYQKLLEPGQAHEFSIKLEPGRYRVRFTGEKAYRWITVAAQGEPGFAFTISDGKVLGADTSVQSGKPASGRIANDSSRRAIGVIESVEWARDALSAAELVADQQFRDLFSSEALAPGIKLAVERATIMFTDLVGSTAMYNDLGDARAFSLVRTHFDILHDVVQKHRGAIVKTIGDAIMAVFTRPDEALAAAHELHLQVDAYVRGKGHDRGAQLKIGLHEGPCIAVTLNERLDYFGTTVNLAARVEHMCQGGDIVISRALSESTANARPLAEHGWTSQASEAHAKGFAQPVPVLRFTRPA